MALKEITSKRRTITFTLGNETVEMTLKRFEGKVRKHDYLGRPDGWGMSGYTCVKCSHFPDADWRPYIDFGEKMTDCSLNGWEANTPEWPLIDDLAMAMIFEYKDWTDDKKYEPVDKILEKLKKFDEENCYKDK